MGMPEAGLRQAMPDTVSILRKTAVHCRMNLVSMPELVQVAPSKKKKRKDKSVSAALSKFDDLNAALADVATQQQRSDQDKAQTRHMPKFRSAAARDRLQCAIHTHEH